MFTYPIYIGFCVWEKGRKRREKRIEEDGEGRENRGECVWLDL